MHLLLSVRPYQGVDFGHINVIEFLHGLFDLVLVGLDIHNEHKCPVFLADSVVRGSFDDGVVALACFSWVHSF